MQHRSMGLAMGLSTGTGRLLQGRVMVQQR